MVKLVVEVFNYNLLEELVLGCVIKVLVCFVLVDLCLYLGSFKDWLNFVVVVWSWKLILFRLFKLKYFNECWFFLMIIYKRSKFYVNRKYVKNCYYCILYDSVLC